MFLKQYEIFAAESSNAKKWKKAVTIKDILAKSASHLKILWNQVTDFKAKVTLFHKLGPEFEEE